MQLDRTMTVAMRTAFAAAAVAGVTFVAVMAGANATAAGFAYLITILLIAIWTNLPVALASAIGATACFNYFFFPPLRTFTIQEPANWVALVAFFLAAVIASRLVVRARTQAAEAEARRNEVQALYDLSVDLFRATTQVGALGDAASRALANVGAADGGLVLFGNGTYDQRVISWSGAKEEEIEELVAGVGRHRRPLEFPAPVGRDVYLPLTLGDNVLGVLAVRRTTATLGALESAATLVALAVERERFLAETAHLRALKEGDALKTSLLRAVSHDLATPLTAIALQVERLQSVVDDPVVSAISEETARLRRRIENLLAMARLEAGSVVPHPEPTPAADLFRAAREHLGLVAEARSIDTWVEARCPEVFVDPSLALEILVNLIENAHQAAPHGSTIELRASRHPRQSGIVRLEIADRGRGLSAGPSDTPRRGLGLEIARTLVLASGGSIELMNRNGGGAVVHVDIPAAELPVVEEVAG